MNLRVFSFHFKLVTVVASLSATALAYVVKEGDTLSSIAYQNISKNVYGEDGSLKKILALNPQIKNPHVIFPGDKIQLENLNPVLADSRAEAVVAPQRALAAESETPLVKSAEAPTPVAPQAVAAAESEGYSLIELSPKFFYSRIDGRETSNGSEANLLSKMNYGLEFSWRQIWSESFETHVMLGISKIEISDATSRNLESSSLTQSELEAGARWHLSERSTLLFSVGAGDEIFYRATAPTSVKLESVMVPQASLGISQDLYSRKPFTLAADLKLTALMGAKTENYDIKSGWGYVGRVSVAQAPKNSSLKLSTGLFYGQKFQNTSILDLTRTDLGLDFNLRWSFGK